MTDAEDRVRNVAAGIATGEVMTYGEIGQITGLGPRHVGRIVARIGDDIAWWRIVRADGTPAACHDGRAAALLKGEGVEFVGDRVSRSAFCKPLDKGSGPARSAGRAD